MGSRFVRPETATLRISNGDTLTVKRRLNHGEQSAAYARMYRANPDGTLDVNPLQTGVALVTAYLLDWSLVDDDGPVIIRDQSIEAVTAALNALDTESFTEIKRAIEQHEEIVLKEREAAKNGQGGETPSSAISPSLAV